MFFDVNLLDPAAIFTLQVACPRCLHSETHLRSAAFIAEGACPSLQSEAFTTVNSLRLRTLRTCSVSSLASVRSSQVCGPRSFAVSSNYSIIWGVARILAGVRSSQVCSPRSFAVSRSSQTAAIIQKSGV